MARPMKEGVDYFPLDVRMDEKVGLLEAEHGTLGFGVLIKLYQRIYANGYFCQWSPEMALLFGRECDLPVEKVEAVLQTAVRRGLFDQRLLEDFGILSSRGIQMRYFAIVTQRKQVFIMREYLLVLEASLPKKDIFVFLSVEQGQGRLGYTQRIEKEKIGKQSKEATGGAHPQGGAVNQMNDTMYEQIRALFAQHCPSLPRLREITPRRKRLVTRAAAILEKHGEDFAQLWQRVGDSDFLTGRKGDWFGCGFDWILAPNNLIKILEGQYDNRAQSGCGQQSSYKISDFEKLNVFDIKDGN